MSSEHSHNARRGRVFAYAPLVFWVAVILILGSGPGASAQTSRFIRPLIEFFFPGAPPDMVLIAHAFIRKAAHFVEYAVLALLAARASLISPLSKLQDHRIVFPLAIVAAIAVVDEMNQSFIGSRTSSGWDVVLDAAGGVAALLFLWFVRRSKERAQARHPDLPPAEC